MNPSVQQMSPPPVRLPPPETPLPLLVLRSPPPSAPYGAFWPSAGGIGCSGRRKLGKQGSTAWRHEYRYVWSGRWMKGKAAIVSINLHAKHNRIGRFLRLLCPNLGPKRIVQRSSQSEAKARTPEPPLRRSQRFWLRVDIAAPRLLQRRVSEESRREKFGGSSSIAGLSCRGSGSGRAPSRYRLLGGTHRRHIAYGSVAFVVTFSLPLTRMYAYNTRPKPRKPVQGCST